MGESGYFYTSAERRMAPKRSILHLEDLRLLCAMAFSLYGFSGGTQIAVDLLDCWHTMMFHQKYLAEGSGDHCSLGGPFQGWPVRYSAKDAERV
jgi:hypothetical protein